MHGREGTKKKEDMTRGCRGYSNRCLRGRSRFSWTGEREERMQHVGVQVWWGACGVCAFLASRIGAGDAKSDETRRCADCAARRRNGSKKTDTNRRSEERPGSRRDQTRQASTSTAATENRVSMFYTCPYCKRKKERHVSVKYNDTYNDSNTNSDNKPSQRE